MRTPQWKYVQLIFNPRIHFVTTSLSIIYINACVWFSLPNWFGDIYWQKPYFLTKYYYTSLYIIIWQVWAFHCETNLCKRFEYCGIVCLICQLINTFKIVFISKRYNLLINNKILGNWLFGNMTFIIIFVCA
jgi:hypothetical protein